MRCSKTRPDHLISSLPSMTFKIIEHIIEHVDLIHPFPKIVNIECKVKLMRSQMVTRNQMVFIKSNEEKKIIR